MSQSFEDAQEATIEGETFRVRMFDPLVALDLEVDILQTLGPALGSVISALLKAEDSGAAIGQLLDGIRPAEGDASMGLSEGAQAVVGDLLGDSLERAVAGFVDRLSKPKLREIVQTMMAVTSIRRGEQWPELSTVGTVVFRGRLKLLHKWLAFSIKAQYRDF